VFGGMKPNGKKLFRRERDILAGRDGCDRHRAGKPERTTHVHEVTPWKRMETS
jgi:hypothetical protein